MHNIVDINAAKTENGFLLNTAEHYLTYEMSVDCDGYYEIELNYLHNIWEAYIRLEITRSDGEGANLLVSLPHGVGKTTQLIFLKTGKNTLHFKYFKGSEIQILNIENNGKTKKIPYEISPENLLLFEDKPKTLRTHLRNYKDKLVSIKADDRVYVPFQIKYQETPNECKQTMINVFPDKNTVSGLGEGEHILFYYFESGNVLTQKLTIRKETPETKLQILNFDIGQANSTLIFLPNGKKLLIDSGTETAAREKIIPWLEKNSIKLDYYLLTHFHNDHDGCREEIIEKNKLLVPDENIINEKITAEKESRYEYLKNFTYLDSTMLCCYDELHKIWDLGGAWAEILNSRFDENGLPIEIYNYSYMEKNEHNYENATSVSFMLDYNGFRFYHGADNYAYTQNRYMSDMIKAKRTDELKCDFFYANHHFVWDINTSFINTLNPTLVYVSNEYIYHRIMYTKNYKKYVKDYYFASKRLQDTLISNEVGTVKVCVNGSDDWYYETIQDKDI